MAEDRTKEERGLTCSLPTHSLLNLAEFLTTANFSQGLKGQLTPMAPTPVWSGNAVPFSLCLSETSLVLNSASQVLELKAPATMLGPDIILVTTYGSDMLKALA